MSGKTTFMKTIGILTWFGHAGVPIPAKQLTLPIFNGLFTTINLADNLKHGYSHFYAEVNRVKEMAYTIEKNGNIVVILDELFRGTNVKDAYEGTLMIVKTLAKIKGTFFFVSTHILEVSEKLMSTEGVDFRCFGSVMMHNAPQYDYVLKPGISTERVGMQIIKHENIEELLKEIIRQQSEAEKP